MNVLTGPGSDRRAEPRAWTLPYREFEDVLVVLDGPRRLLWSGDGPATWRPLRMWPSHRERIRLLDRLERRAPLLVVVDRPPCEVPMLPEELAHAPFDVRELAQHPHEVPVTVPVTVLDWLPEPWRSQGEAFVADGLRMIESNPKLLLSSLIGDAREGGSDSVRFALRTGTGAIPDAVLGSYARSAFRRFSDAIDADRGEGRAA